VYLNRFKIIRPRYEMEQEHALHWISQLHARAEALVNKDQDFDSEGFSIRMNKLSRRFGCSPKRIQKRGYDLTDFQHFDWHKMRLFNLEKNPNGAGMAERMAFFNEVADQKLNALLPTDTPPPTDLIHVTCTGYQSPSAAQRLVEKRNWHETTRVTHVYHMGCYASIPAIRIAGGYLATGSEQVDICHTEICSIHGEPLNHSPQQLVVQSLFADGHIKYSVSRNAEPHSFEILNTHEITVPDSLSSMTWMVSTHGLQMTLSLEVPKLIAHTLPAFLSKLFQGADMDYNEVKSEVMFAIHPGGPRIVDGIAELLELDERQVKMSSEILRDYGNMSSATLPHLWNSILEQDDIPAGRVIASLAFGPGLTIAGNLLRKR